MKNSSFFIIVLTVVFFIVFSCKTHETLSSTKKSGDDTIVIKLKDTAFVKIPDNPSTGYRWNYIAESGSDIINYVGNSFNNPTPELIGSAGVRTFKFKALKKGVTVIKFYKRRGPQPPVDSMKVLIAVEK